MLEFQCRFVKFTDQVGDPKILPSKDKSMLLYAQVDSRTSTAVVFSRLRSFLFEDTLQGVLGNRSDEPAMMDAIRKAVKQAASLAETSWSAIPAHSLEDGAATYAVFELSWGPKLTFVKVKQNRLYQVNMGNRLLGGLKRPGRDEAWHFFVPLVANSAKGNWQSLAAAKQGVAALIEAGSIQ